MKEIFAKTGEKILVDDSDYDALSVHIWSIDKDGYAYRHIPHPIKPGQATILMMHREILGLSLGDRRQCDHRFGKKLDNRRSELRICLLGENVRNVGRRSDNTSGYKGVYLHGESGRWRAQIYVKGKKKCLGQYDTAPLAHDAYCAAAKQLHGEFANFGV